MIGKNNKKIFKLVKPLNFIKITILYKIIDLKDYSCT